MRVFGMVRGMSAVTALVVALALVAGALIATHDAGAVETDGTVQACVNGYTSMVRVADSCQPHEDWLLIEGVYNNPEPPPRPTATEGPDEPSEPSEPEPTATTRRAR